MLAAVMVMTSAAVWMGNEKQAEAAAAFKVHFIEVGTVPCFSMDQGKVQNMR